MAEEQRFKRLYPRRQFHTACRVSCADRLIMGKIVDVSYNGVSLLLPGTIELTELASVEIPKRVRLRVRPVYLEQANGERNLMGCRIEFIEHGEPQWMNLCYVPRW